MPTEPFPLNCSSSLAVAIELNPSRLITERIGAYRVEQPLGQGATSLVYRARHIGDVQRLVALKILRPHLAGQREALRHFRLEGIIGRLLDHPHIVHTFETHLTSGLFVLVNDYLDHSGSLDLLIRRQRRLTPGHTWVIGCQLAAALRYLHDDLGILHGDIKPRNILVRPAGRLDSIHDTLTASLIDFGIATTIPNTQRLSERLSDELSPPPHPLNRPDAFWLIGTPAFLPPELLLGTVRLVHDGDRPQVDVYALGVTLYVALTDQLPYEGRTFPELCHALKAGAPVAPQDIVPSTTSALNALVMKAIHPNPEDRYMSAAHLLADLLNMSI